MQGNLSAMWQFFASSAGYARYDNPATSKKLTDAPTEGVTLPAYATHALLFVLDNPVRIQFGGAAVATKGGKLPAGFIWVIENQRDMLKNLAFINESGAAKIEVHYARMPDGSVAACAA